MTVPLVRAGVPLRAPNTGSGPWIERAANQFGKKLIRANAQLGVSCIRTPDRRQDVDAPSRPQHDGRNAKRVDGSRAKASRSGSTRGPEIDEGNYTATQKTQKTLETASEQTVGDQNVRQDSLEGDEQATGRGGLDFGRPTLLAVLTGTPDEVFRGEGKIQAIQLSAGGATVGHDLLREQRSGNSSGFGHVPQAQAAGAFIPVASIPLLGQNGVFSTSASPPSLPVSVEDQANVARVARGIAGAVNQNGGVVTLRLQPPEMGMVRIELQIDNGTVRVAVVAEQESARAMLHDQIAQLRHALESQGLNVERLNVQAMQSNDPATNTEQQAGDSPAEGRSRGSFDSPGSDGKKGGDGGGTRDGSATFQQTLNAVA